MVQWVFERSDAIESPPDALHVQRNSSLDEVGSNPSCISAHMYVESPLKSDGKQWQSVFSGTVAGACAS